MLLIRSCVCVRGRRYRMPENSIPKEAAYQIISDELMLDGNPRLNLASFVTTWMEPECNKLMMDSINKNYVDMDEYPVTTELQVYYIGTSVFPSDRARSLDPGFIPRSNFHSRYFEICLLFCQLRTAIEF